MGKRLSRFNLAPCDEVAAAPSSTSFDMGGNESYGVPLHVNNSGKLKRDKVVSAPSSTAFAIGGNASYGVSLHVNNSGKLKRDKAVSAPSSAAFAMGGNASYGVSLHVNNSSELEPSQLTGMKQYLHHPPLHLLVCLITQAHLHPLFSTHHLLVLTIKILPCPALPSVLIWAEHSLCCLCCCWHCCWL